MWLYNNVQIHDFDNDGMKVDDDDHDDNDGDDADDDDKTNSPKLNVPCILMVKIKMLIITEWCNILLSPFSSWQVRFIYRNFW